MRLSSNLIERDKPIEQAYLVGLNPSWAKFAAIRLSAQPTRKSAEHASLSPPPIAAPWTAATTGVLASIIRAASK